uniref:Uncharacterized protein n=1 Tax=Arundo donax TaxID=35708 RepID=A0A0A9HDP5_ARUDO
MLTPGQSGEEIYIRAASAPAATTPSTNPTGK